MRKSPAQAYALTFGATLVLAGIVGFFYDGSFSTGASAAHDHGALIGVFDVNGWHNVVHIVSGAIGLALADSWVGARLYALGFGLIYLLVAAIGFALGDGHAVFGLIPVNDADNVLHLAIAVLGLIAAAASPAAPPPTRVGERSRALEPSVPQRV
jgi:hypothetical protein